mgnify:CR=1 FL=1
MIVVLHYMLFDLWAIKPACLIASNISCDHGGAIVDVCSPFFSNTLPETEVRDIGR